MEYRGSWAASFERHYTLTLAARVEQDETLAEREYEALLDYGFDPHAIETLWDADDARLLAEYLAMGMGE